MDTKTTYKEEPEEKDILDLWEETFGDNRDYCRLVYRRYASTKMSEAVYKDGKVASTLAAARFQIASDEGPLIGHYICQLATRPEYRGEGLMSLLLRKVEDRAASAGDNFTFLIPADENLREMYSRKGYKSIGRRRRLVLPPIRENRIFEKDWVVGRDFSILAKEESGAVIENLTRFEDCGYSDHTGRIRHSENQWQLIIEENKMNGGTIIHQDRQWFAFLERRDEETLTVREILISPKLNGDERVLETIMAAIFIMAEGKRVTYLMPSSYPIWNRIEAIISKHQIYPESDEEEPYAMFKEIQTGKKIPENIQINLMLD